MIGLDTNVLIPLLVKSSETHQRARSWLEANEAPLSTTSTNLGETLRLLTHPRVFRRPMRLANAVRLLRRFLDAYSVSVLEEEEEWLDSLESLAAEIPALRGNDVFDARIALTLKFNGVKAFCTLDADFRRFPFLDIETI